MTEVSRMHTAAATPVQSREQLGGPPAKGTSVLWALSVTWPAQAQRWKCDPEAELVPPQ